MVNRIATRKATAAAALLAVMGMGVATAGSAVAADKSGGVDSVSAPAAAVSAPVSAQAGALHLWGSEHFSGHTVHFTASNSWLGDNRWDGTNTSVDNGANSAQNTRTRPVVGYTIGSTTGACGGDYLRIFGGQAYWTLDLRPWGGNNLNNTFSCLVFE
ncbi:hypothetical protein ABZ714_01545 [Streptomyces sp. NPDC006798]|uniref:hypothetical protein n=1 Tax=Streptomyces sp. NPDC006798 TaxID=3155462 RepID=UPI003411710A